MKWKNKYYTIAFWGAVLTLMLQVIIGFIIDPYLIAVLSPFYSVWIILWVVGWRKEHPRQ